MSDDSTNSKVPVAVLEYEPSGFEQTLIKHKSKLILVGVIAIAGTVGYWGYRLYSEASHKSAAVDFVRANSVQELKEAASKHEGKAGGGNALVLAADKLSADNPKDAIALLRDFLSKYPDHPLRDLAAWRIAEYLTKADDAAGAEKAYDEVVKAGTPYSAFALLRLGDLKWSAGDTAKAQEYYDLILNNGAMSGSPIRAAAKNRVEKGLKAKAPVLVDYKEEPPTPPPGAAPLKVQGLGDINGGPGSGSPDSLLPPPILPQLPPTPAPAVEIMPKPEAPPANPAEAPPPVKPADAPKPAAPPKPATEPKPEEPPAAKPAEAPPANPAEAPKPAASPAPATEPEADPPAAKPAETPAPAEAPKEAPRPEVKPDGK